MSVLERVSLLNSYQTLLNDDSDFSRFESRLTNFWSWVLFSDMAAKPEFDISGTSWTATITSWEAIITTTRATSSPITWKKTPVRYQLSDTKILTWLVSWSKIYIEIDQTLVDNPTLIQDTYPSTDYANWLNIWTLTHATSRPATNTYIPLWELSWITWTWTDWRSMPKIKGNRIDFVDVDGNISTEGNVTGNIITALTSSYAQEFYTPSGGVQEQIDTIEVISEDAVIGKVSLTAWENVAIWDNLCYKNTEASETVTYANQNSNFNRWRSTGTDYNVAEKITMSAVWYYQRINTVTYYIGKNNAPADNVVVKLYNDDLVTIIDTSSAIVWSTLNAWAETTCVFTFSWVQNLIPWKTYYLVLCRTWAENWTNNYQVRYNSTWWSNEVYKFDATDWEVWWAAYRMKSIKTITTYAIDPTTVMKMDANDPLKIQDAGLATETKTTGQSVSVQMSGVVAGLTGLTPNLYYYASDTAGALSTTPSTTYNIRIGKAISSTQLLIDKKKIYNTLRTFANVDCQYNWWWVDYNKLFSNKYIRYYIWFRPTKINIRWSHEATASYDTVSMWYSDWIVNNNISLFFNTTLRSRYSDTLSFKITYSESAEFISWTILFLNNWFEVYYSKSWDTVFVWWWVVKLYFDVE